MPCHGPDPRDYERGDDYKEEYRAAKSELDKVTALLCFVMNGLSPSTITFLTNDETVHDGTTGKDLKKWWKKHQLIDKRRFEKEQQEKKDIDDTRAALKKLSARERKLLSRKDLEIHSSF